MKKRMITVALGLTMTALIIGTGVSRVAAEPETDPAEEQEAEVVEEASSEEEAEDTDSEDAAEVADSEEETDFEEVEAVSEEPEEEDVIEGMPVLLENALSQDVTAIEISGFAGETYSENLLLNDRVLQAGEEMTIGIPEEFQDHELGMYNVRITLNDGTIEDIPFVPFLENTKGTFYSENGIVLIRVRDERMEAEAEPVSEAEIRQREAEASQIMAEALSAEIE